MHYLGLFFFLCLPLVLEAQQGKTHRLGGNIIVHVPAAAYQDPLPLLLVFGGSHYATPQFMWEQTPEDYFRDAILVYAPCYVKGGFGYRPIRERVESFLREEGLKVKQFSVCGFSSGGSDALLANPLDCHAIGLIDPVPETEGGPIRAHSNVILSFRRKNWIYSEQYGEAAGFAAFNRLAELLHRAGGTVEEAEVPHKDYPNYFFKRFREQLLGE